MEERYFRVGRGKCRKVEKQMYETNDIYLRGTLFK